MGLPSPEPITDKGVDLPDGLDKPLAVKWGHGVNHGACCASRPHGAYILRMKRQRCFRKGDAGGFVSVSILMCIPALCAFWMEKAKFGS